MQSIVSFSFDVSNGRHRDQADALETSGPNDDPYVVAKQHTHNLSTFSELMYREESFTTTTIRWMRNTRNHDAWSDDHIPQLIGALVQLLFVYY